MRSLSLSCLNNQMEEPDPSVSPPEVSGVETGVGVTTTGVGAGGAGTDTGEGATTFLGAGFFGADFLTTFLTFFTTFLAFLATFFTTFFAFLAAFFATFLTTFFADFFAAFLGLAFPFLAAFFTFFAMGLGFILVGVRRSLRLQCSLCKCSYRLMMDAIRNGYFYRRYQSGIDFTPSTTRLIVFT